MKFAFEGLLFALLVASSVLLIGMPLYHLWQVLFPKKSDSLEEARIRLEAAKRDLEAARLNKEAEKMYSEIYEEVLEDTNLEKESDRK